MRKLSETITAVVFLVLCASVLWVGISDIRSKQPDARLLLITKSQLEDAQPWIDFLGRAGGGC